MLTTIMYNHDNLFIFCHDDGQTAMILITLTCNNILMKITWTESVYFAQNCSLWIIIIKWRQKILIYSHKDKCFWDADGAQHYIALRAFITRVLVQKDQYSYTICLFKNKIINFLSSLTSLIFFRFSLRFQLPICFLLTSIELH